MEKTTNGQFEFVRKLLAINTLSSAEDTVFENFVRFINNECRLLVDGLVSKLLQKASVINKVENNPKSFRIEENSVKDFLQSVVKREKELKNLDPYLDNDLWNYFKTSTYQFLTQRQILSEAEKTGIKKVYLEGLSKIRRAILDGQVDKKGAGITVYFTVTVDGVNSLYHFRAFRYVDCQLRVRVDKGQPRW